MIKPLSELTFVPLKHWLIFSVSLLVILVEIWCSYPRHMFKVRHSINLVTLKIFLLRLRLPHSKLSQFISCRYYVVRTCLKIHHRFLVSIFFSINSSSFRISSISFFVHFAIVKVWSLLFFHVINSRSWWKFLLYLV